MRRQVVSTVVLVLAAGCASGLAGCGSRGSSVPSNPSRPSVTTTSLPVTPTTMAPVPTSVALPVTTSVAPAVPAALQPSAQAAATALVSAWATGNRAGALTVATPAAVATLFAVSYSAVNAVARGCSAGSPPIVCTYGAPGGGNVNAAIYQLSASQSGSGWYIETVTVES